MTAGASMLLTLRLHMLRLSLALVVTLGMAHAAHSQMVQYENLLRTPEYRTFRYYPLGDSPGPQIADRISGAPGTLVGAPLTRDGPMFNTPAGGTGLAFDGITQHALIPASSFGSQFDSPDGATVIIWFQADESSRGCLLGTMSAPDYRSGFQLLLGANPFFYLSNPYQLTFTVNFSTGDFVSCSVYTVEWTNRDWHMLAATYQNGVVQLFYDGQSLRLTLVEQGGVGRVGNFVNDIAVAALNEGTISNRKRTQAAHLSLHNRALSLEQVRALWFAANGSTGQSVYNVDAVRPWFQAASTQRVDAALVGDSNILFGLDANGAYGHQFGMAQGLRSVLPIYAGPVISGVGVNGWANTVNAFTNFLPGAPIPPQAPLFIEMRMPFASFGFPTKPYYIPAGSSVPVTSSLRGPIFWESSDFLFDFRRSLDWHFAYATFSDGAAGVMYPGVRLNLQPFTPLAQTQLSSVGAADGISRTSLSIPAAPRTPGSAYALQINDPVNSLPAVGPFALLYHRFVVADQTAGASMTPLWAVGGESARYAADIFANFTFTSQLSEYLYEMVRHQPPGQERLLVQILEGGNDNNDYRLAINPDGSLSERQSQSAEGQKINTRTILERIRAAWVARGFDPAKLCFLLGPYHPSPTSGERIRAVYVRGWRELARDMTGFNIAVMDAYGFTSVEEFYQGGWYNNNNADVAHLARAGYLNFGRKTWQTLYQAAATDPVSLGACCMGSTCAVRALADCTGPLTRYAGPGVACNPAGQVVTPCCKADFNQDRALTVQDVFDFISAFFVQDPTADFSNNGSGPPTAQSIFDFVAAWFSGC